MLTNGTVTANIPAADLDRARAFYADKLGLEPTSEIAGEVLMYATQGGTPFSVYRTDFAGTAGHTLAQWHVDDVEAEVRDLQAKGVTFETYDMPGAAVAGRRRVDGGHGQGGVVQGQRGQHPLHRLGHDVLTVRSARATGRPPRPRRGTPDGSRARPTARPAGARRASGRARAAPA